MKDRKYYVLQILTSQGKKVQYSSSTRVNTRKTLFPEEPYFVPNVLLHLSETVPHSQCKSDVIILVYI